MTTVKRILFSYVTVAVCAVALGLTMILTGIGSQMAHHLTAAVAPTSADDTSQQTLFHDLPSVQSAEAAILPFPVFSYTTLNYAVDGDGAAGPQILKVTPEFHGRNCEFCIKAEYNPYIKGKAAFALTTARPLDVENPQRLILLAKGEYGGEQIRFMLLGKPNGTISSSVDDELFDNVEFASKSKPLTLTTNFRTYHVDVPAVDPEKLEDITHLVAVEIDAGKGVRPVVIYVDGLVYDGNEPDQRFIVEQAEGAVTS